MRPTGNWRPARFERLLALPYKKQGHDKLYELQREKLDGAGFTLTLPPLPRPDMMDWNLGLGSGLRGMRESVPLSGTRGDQGLKKKNK